MNEDSKITCPDCGHTFTVRDDVLAKVNYIGMRIDQGVAILEKSLKDLSGNPMFGAFLSKMK